MKRGRLFGILRRSKVLPIFIFITMLVVAGNAGFAQAAVTGPGAPIAVSDGQTVPPFPMIDNGQVNAVVSDNAGGWYVGGSFTSVAGDTNFKRLVHITSAGALDTAWNPSLNSFTVVRTLLLSGTRLYAGTSSPTVQVLAFNTAAPGNILCGISMNGSEANALALNGSTLYFGGNFTTVSGSNARNALAAINATTCALQTFNPNVRQLSAGGVVNSLLFDSSTLYVGGLFTTIGTNNASRNNAAAVDTAGVANGYNPNVGGTNARVLSIQKPTASNSVYLCGNFTSVSGNNHNGIAETTLTPNSGEPTSWDPQLPFGTTVNSCLLRGNSIYAGGTFTSVNNGSLVRNRVAEFDRTVLTNNATAWNPNTNDTVKAMALNGAQTVVYVGGLFTSIGAAPADTTAPVSTLTTSPASPNGTNGWFTSDVGYTVSATDNGGSGVSNIYVCVDQTNTCNPQTVNSGVTGTVSNEGTNYIRYQSKDVAGNIEGVNVGMVKLDKTNPSGSLNSLLQYDGDGQINLAWNTQDTVSGVTSVQLFRGATLIDTSTTSNGSFVDDRSAQANDGQSFTYYVRITDTAGRTFDSADQSTTVDLSAASVPAIVPLPAYTTVSHVGVSWHRSVDATAGVDLYNFFKTVFTSPFTTVDETDPQGTDTAQLRSYDDTAVTEGQSYSYKVSSVDLAVPSHESALSDIATTTIDLTAPVTSIVRGPVNPNGQNDWYVQPVSVDFTCQDAVSGCAQTYYRINGGAYQLFTGAFLVDQDGTYTIDFYSIDNAGNTEVAQSSTVKLDQTQPLLVEDAIPATTSNATLVLTGTATDQTSGVQSLTINNEGVTVDQNGAFSHNVTLLEGQNTITTVLTDNAGNTVTSVRYITLDTIAPISTVTTDPVSPNGDNVWFTSDVGYTVTAEDANGSGVANIYVCVDQTNTCDPQTNDSGVSGTIFAEGTSYIAHRAIDNAGNLEDIKLDIIALDKTDPIISLGNLPAFDGDGLIHLSWNASDAVSGVQEVKIFRGATLIYTTTSATGNFVDDLSAPANDGQTFSYTAQVRDMAGRVTVSSAQTTTIDFTAPVSTLTTTPATPNGTNGWFISDVDYTVSSADSGSGVANIYVCVDQTNTCDPQTVNSGATGTISNDGTSYIRFQSKDNVDNIETVQVAVIKIDKSNPTISLQALLQYDGDGFINVSWNTSDTVSGVQEVRVYRDNALISTSTNANGNFVDDRSGVLNDGQSFTYRAEVTDVAGRNGISANQSTTIDLSAASVPDMMPLPAYTNTTSVTAQWHRSVDATAGVDLYNLFKDVFTSVLTSVDETDPQGTDSLAQRSYTDFAVVHGETHTYKASSLDLATPAHESQQSNGATTTIDTSKPITTALLMPSSPNGQNGWYKTAISVSLSCADTVSGCAQTFISINGAPFSGYTGPFVISTDGQYTVSYYSVDNAGNTEVASTINLKLDKTAPIINDDPTPATTNNASLTLTGTVIDATSGVQSFTINGQSVTLAGNGSYSHTITLSQGLNTITYVATDVAGNQTTVIRTITLVTNDADGDGVIDSQDVCPTIPGTAQRQGCPVGLNEIVTFHKKGGAHGPLANATIRVFDRNDGAFISAYGTQKPAASQFPTIFEAGIGQVATCTTDAQGACTAGLVTAGHNYLTVVKFVDGTNAVFYDGDFTNSGTFSDTNNDGQPDSATGRINMNLN